MASAAVPVQATADMCSFCFRSILGYFDEVADSSGRRSRPRTPPSFADDSQ